MGRRRIRKTPAGRTPLTAKSAGGYWQAFAEQANIPQSNPLWLNAETDIEEYARRDARITAALLAPSLISINRPKPQGIFTPALVACFFKAPERREIIQAGDYEEALSIAQPRDTKGLDLRIRQRILERLDSMTFEQRAVYLFHRDPRMLIMETSIIDGGKWFDLKSRANNFLGMMDGNERIGSRERAGELQAFFTTVERFLENYEAWTEGNEGWWNGYVGELDIRGPVSVVLQDPAVTAGENQFRSDGDLGALVRLLLACMGIAYRPKLEFKALEQYLREYAKAYFRLHMLQFTMFQTNGQDDVKGSLGRVRARRRLALRELWIPRYLTGGFVTPDSEVLRAG